MRQRYTQIASENVVCVLKILKFAEILNMRALIFYVCICLLK